MPKGEVNVPVGHPLALNTIFCDVGGVLVENPWIHASEAIGSAYGLAKGTVFDELTRLAVELDRGNLTLREYHELLVRSTGAGMPYGDFAALVLDASLTRIGPVWDAIRGVRASGKLKVVALSNMSAEVWGSLEKKYGISSLFDSAVLSFELRVTKPDPKIFGIALERAGSLPEDSLFVDDTPQNIGAALSLGMQTYLAKNPDDTARFLRAL